MAFHRGGVHYFYSIEYFFLWLRILVLISSHVLVPCFRRSDHPSVWVWCRFPHISRAACSRFALSRCPPYQHASLVSPALLRRLLLDFQFSFRCLLLATFFLEMVSLPDFSGYRHLHFMHGPGFRNPTLGLPRVSRVGDDRRTYDRCFLHGRRLQHLAPSPTDSSALARLASELANFDREPWHRAYRENRNHGSDSRLRLERVFVFAPLSGHPLAPILDCGLPGGTFVYQGRAFERGEPCPNLRGGPQASSRCGTGFRRICWEVIDQFS